ncbi:MAG: hypothetical protein ABR555_19490 [Pyrinomonadaceae bacterium]
MTRPLKNRATPDNSIGHGRVNRRQSVQRKFESNAHHDDPGWREDIEILRDAALRRAREKRQVSSAFAGPIDHSFQDIADLLGDPSEPVRNRAVRKLYEIDPDRAASYFNLALRDAAPEERRRLGAAFAGSGLVIDAINNLMSASHQHSYRAFSLLFLVAKAGEVQQLMRVIESHPNIEVRLAVIRLLASSGESEVATAFRRLSSRRSLPAEVRSATVEAIQQISTQAA